MFNEDFERCPKCDSPYFEKKELYTILKDGYDNKEERVTEHEKFIQFVCAECQAPYGGRFQEETFQVHE